MIEVNVYSWLHGYIKTKGLNSVIKGTEFCIMFLNINVSRSHTYNSKVIYVLVYSFLQYILIC